jgi:hypothetical protein
MTGYDYRVLADVEDDVLLLEWDIAIGKTELEAFIARVQAAPSQVLVAPYRIYQSLSGKAYPFHPLWAHRRYEGTPETGRTRFVTEADSTCHLFGFGMVYLPRLLVVAFLEAWGGHFDDSAFSGWHYRNAPDPEVPICWEVRPVHLHYKFDDLGTQANASGR